MAKRERPNRHTALIVLLSVASLVLVLSTVFMIEILSIAYGVGAGAEIQSAADSMNVTGILIRSAAGSHAIYTTILAEYVGLIVSLGMLLTSVLLYRYNSSIMASEAKGHTNLHGMLTLVYILLFSVYISSSPISISTYYLWAVYGIIALCALVDIYLIAYVRFVVPYRTHSYAPESIAIDPSKPYTNLIKMKDNVFSHLSGNVFIVDKHMNSAGMENLHRLIINKLGSINELSILTSSEMLDSEFTKNYSDWKSEMSRAGVKLNVMVMNDEDATAQHERFVFNGSHAYKVPPFNIIHKKSEHITKISMADAKKRYEQLQKHSMKYENFIVRAGQVQPKK